MNLHFFHSFLFSVKFFSARFDTWLTIGAEKKCIDFWWRIASRNENKIVNEMSSLSPSFHAIIFYRIFNHFFLFLATIFLHNSLLGCFSFSFWRAHVKFEMSFLLLSLFATSHCCDCIQLWLPLFLCCCAFQIKFQNCIFVGVDCVPLPVPILISFVAKSKNIKQRWRAHVDMWFTMKWERKTNRWHWWNSTVHKTERRLSKKEADRQQTNQTKTL